MDNLRFYGKGTSLTWKTEIWITAKCKLQGQLPPLPASAATNPDRHSTGQKNAYQSLSL